MPEWKGSQTGCAVDLDGDGYGPGCLKGDDCNDGDSALNAKCDACAVPAPGCACPADSGSIECIEHGPVYEDTMLCGVGKRYCRDGRWSGCESISTFEVPIDRERSVRSTTQALIEGDAALGVQCDACSPACREITDPLDDTMVPLPDPNLTYTSPDGDGITLASETALPTDVTPNTDCAMPCGSTCPMGSYDSDCDGLADDFEIATCTAGDTTCESVRPFTSSATGFTLALGPGEGVSQSMNMQFATRTVDVYFLFDTATTSSTLVDAIKNNLTANQSSPGTPFFYDTGTDLDACATRGQGILGDLQCLLNNAQVGIGFTRDVPFGTDSGGIKYGWDAVDGSAGAGTYDPSNPFSDFLFENLSPITNNTSYLSSQLDRLIVRADPNAAGANAQTQGLYAIASGTEHYVGHDRPAVPTANCDTGRFGYPCFRSTSVPIVVLITGKPMYNGPTTAYTGGAIASEPGSYPTSLHSGKVNIGTYEGYIEVLQSGTDHEDFPTAFRADTFLHPSGGTVGSVHNQLLTFTGDTTNMTADVDAAFFSCTGVTTVAGPDAVHYIDVNSSLPGGTTNLHVSTKGTRFPSLLALIKSDITTPPVFTTGDLTEYCCLDPLRDPMLDCSVSPKPAGCCLAASTCGDTSGQAYDVGTLDPGTSAVLTGELTQAGNFPADVLECFAKANAFQCGNGSKASDTAPDSVFKFNISQDMELDLWSEAAAFPTAMALFVGRPYGVEDIELPATTPEEYLPPSGDPLVLSNNAYRFVVSDATADARSGGDDGCTGFLIDDLDPDYDTITVWQNATDMTPSDGDPACKNVDEDAADMEIPFTITDDNTQVSFSTSGQQPTGELSGSVAIAIREIATPTSVVLTPPASYDTWTSPPWDIPPASFTSTDPAENQIAVLPSTILGATSSASSLTLLTEYYDAYRCVADDVNLCNLPTTYGQGSCLGSGVEEVDDNWLNSTVDIMYSFTIPTDDPSTLTVNEAKRSLKIGAVGVDGAKHHLVLFDAAAINAVPPVPDTAGLSINENATVSSLGSFTTETLVDPGDKTFSLGAGATSTKDVSARTGDAISSDFQLGTLALGDTVTSSTATMAATMAANYDTLISCNTLSKDDQVFTFTTPATTTTATVTLTAITGVSLMNNKEKYPLFQVFSGMADGIPPTGTSVGSCGPTTAEEPTSTTFSYPRSFTTSPSTKYYVVVSSFRGAAGTSDFTGTYNIKVALDSPAGGDSVATAHNLTALSSDTDFDVIGTGLTTNNSGITSNYATVNTCDDAAGGSKDQVFKFTAPAEPTKIAVTLNPTAFGNYASVGFYQSDGAGGLTQVTCTAGTSGDTSPTATLTSSTGGAEYYVVVSSTASASSGTYSLNFKLDANLYDTVATAGTIALAGDGKSITNTTAAVTNRVTTSNYDATDVTCNAGTTSNDQVYKVTGASIGGDLSVVMTPTAFAGTLAVFSDGGGVLGTSLGCATNAAIGGTVELSIIPTTTTLYVVVTGNTNTSAGQYTLQVAPGLHDTIATAHNFGTIDNTSATVTNSTSRSGVTQNYDTGTPGDPASDTVWCNKTGNPSSSRLGFDQVYKFSVGAAGATKVRVELAPSGFRGVVQVRSASGALGTNQGCAAGSADGETVAVSFAPTAGDYYVFVSGYDSGESGTYTLTVQDIQSGNIGCDTSIAPTRAVVTVKDLPTGTYYVLLKMDIAAVALGVLNPEQVTLAIEDASWEESYGTFTCEIDNYEPYEAVEPHSVVGGSLLKRTQLDMTLDAGDYVAILKRDSANGASPGLLKFTMRDKGYQPDVFACHNTDFNGDGEAVTEFTFAQVCETCTSTTDPYCLNATSGTQCTGSGCNWAESNGCRDSLGVAHYVSEKLPACELTGAAGCNPTTDSLKCRWDPANDCKDGSGVEQYVDYYLVMRASNENDMSPAESPFTYTVHIQDGELAAPTSGCTTGTIPDSFDGTLDNGHYFAVVKGIAGDDAMTATDEADKGWYQLTVGSTALETSGSFTDLQSYNNVLAKLQTPGTGLPPIKVIGIQDGTDATAEAQLKSLAWATATTSVTNQPLVTRINDATADSKTVFTTNNVGYGITRSIQELAQSLVMDVTVVLDAQPQYANPGFDIRIEATGTEPLCMGGKSGKTWFDCHLTALPNFSISVENPPAVEGSVPFQMGGYDMMLNVLGKVQIGNSGGIPTYRTYVVYQIPLHVDATAAAVGGAVFATQGTYSETFAASQCLTTEAPDWSRLTWSGSIPDDSTLEFKICTADTEVDALACTTERAAFVSSGDPCTMDSQCPTGFCHNNQVCWYVEGPACTEDDQCGPRGTCQLSGMTGICMWSALPIDVGAVLRAGDNGKQYAKMEVVLRSSTDQTSAPTLNEWNIEYDCVSTE